MNGQSTPLTASNLNAPSCSVAEEVTESGDLILVAFITGNSSLEPLIEGLYAQIHVNLR